MIFKREPIAIVNAVRLALLAAITFGLGLTDVQLIASMAALEAVLTLVARGQVTPVVIADENIEMFRRLNGLPPADDIPATGSPDRGQSVLVTAAVAACVCLVLLFAFDLIG